MSRRVCVALYDLSHGMAASLSQQILGERIDGIWHSGITVFDTEYYFGGGIQRSGLGRFSASTGMQQVQNIDMGETTKSQHELEVFLRSISSRFTNATYNLLTHNCNHFANEVCTFLTGRGIPSFIVDLPQRVFSTPNGAMLRPMIEQIMVGVNGQQGGLDPFGGGGGGTPLSSTTTGASASFSSPSVSMAAATSSIRTVVAASPPPPAILEELPLLSNDATSAALLGNKILKAVDTTTGEPILSEEEKALLSAVIANLSSSPATNAHFASEPRSFTLLARVIEQQPSCQMAALFLLRLMVLHRELPRGHEATVLALVERINTQGTACFSSLPASVMAVCTLANWMSHDRQEVLSAAHRDVIIDVAMRLMTTHEKNEIKHMSAALAYNVTLSCTQGNAVTGYWSNGDGSSNDELHPHALQILCASLEDIASESSKEVRRRRLAIALRIARAQRQLVAALASDLGFVDALLQFQNSMEGQSVKRDDADGNERGILHELLSLLRTA